MRHLKRRECLLLRDPKRAALRHAQHHAIADTEPEPDQDHRDRINRLAACHENLPTGQARQRRHSARVRRTWTKLIEMQAARGEEEESAGDGQVRLHEQDEGVADLYCSHHDAGD